MKKIFASILALTLVFAAFSAVTVFAADEKDPDTWLCKAGGGMSTGWWMNPFSEKEWEFSATFEAPNAFDGFVSTFFANEGDGATVTINLLDKDGKQLDTQTYKQVSNGTATVKFSKAYAPGKYTIQIKSTDKGVHFVVASGEAGDVSVEVGGNCVTNTDTLAAPAIALTGAVNPAGKTDDKPEENGDDTPALTFVDKAFSDGEQSIGVWLNENSPSAYVKFTTVAAFKGVSASIYWASCVSTKTGPEADWTVELYKFSGNNESTLAKKPVKSTSVHSVADNDPKLSFDFDEAVEAGTYIVKFTVTNVTEEQDFDGEMKKPYIVLPKIDNPDAAKFDFSGDAFNLHVNAASTEGEFFLNNPKEGNNPATADASVIAIAAVACVALAGVVVAKKIK